MTFGYQNSTDDYRGTLIFLFIFIVFLLSIAYPAFGGVLDSGVVLTLLVAVGILFTAIYICAGSIREKESNLDEIMASMDLEDIYPGYDDETEDLTQAVPKPIPGVAKSIAKVDLSPESDETQVKVLRGGEFVGNRMRLKVKVVNESPYIISDITVYILTYPHNALKYAGEDQHKFFSKIEPGGFRSPTFDFLPTQDCVKGEIVAGVSYIDMMGIPHTLTTKPFMIRSVCDLLLPYQVTPKDFELKLKELECGEISIKIDEWTPEEMFDKALRIVNESNFFEVSSEVEETHNISYGKIVGFAKGKYTGNEVAVEINISGTARMKGASCTIRVSGEDQAMILPAIDDLKERLNAWLCPLCSSPLTLKNVADLKEGKVIECPFCSVSIGR
jgi:hypothetical protein